MYKLVISDDEGKTIIVPLVRDLITVGRQDGNTIRLTERNVSRQHARFVRDASGYRIEDLDSYNGISVNGVRIEKTSELKDGDRVGVGDYVIALRAEASTGTAATRANGRAASAQGFGAPPPARLVMISAPAPGAEFSMTKSAVSIGRLEELDLCISHRSISREHARVTQKAGGFEIEDLRSANGVRVNGASVKRSTLRSSDLVELGQVRFRFVGQGESYTYDPAEEQAALLSVPKARPGKQTVWALVGAAALAGGVLAFCQDGSNQAGAAMREDTPPAPPEPVTTTALAPSTEELPDQARLGALLETCKQGLDHGQYA
ncbi:MAG TPA: FHA domain-containing protein, partial [Polyangiales bacterium]|nr:FHA domain-containing protein [Polyangiales bacterium]